MRWSLVSIASVALLAGCTPVPQPAVDDDMVPHELIQQYANWCFQNNVGDEGGFYTYSIREDGADVDADDADPARIAVAQAIEDCLNRYDYEVDSPLAFVPAYERAQLYDYYVTRTRPCLARLGVSVPEVERSEFFSSDQRLWNPYPQMQDVPFEHLLTLYRACPPVPDYVLSRHVNLPAAG